MTDEDVEPTAEPESVPEPDRWGKLAAWGAVALILLGGLLAAWAFFRWEDALPIPLLGPLAAKIVAIGLVFAGGAVLGHLNERTPGLESTNDAKDH